jgi:hypothetical protein
MLAGLLAKGRPLICLHALPDISCATHILLSFFYMTSVVIIVEAKLANKHRMDALPIATRRSRRFVVTQYHRSINNLAVREAALPFTNTSHADTDNGHLRGVLDGGPSLLSG